MVGAETRHALVDDVVEGEVDANNRLRYVKLRNFRRRDFEMYKEI